VVTDAKEQQKQKQKPNCAHSNGQSRKITLHVSSKKQRDLGYLSK
jgi:hypothetical protein